MIGEPKAAVLNSLSKRLSINSVNHKKEWFTVTYDEKKRPIIVGVYTKTIKMPYNATLTLYFNTQAETGQSEEDFKKNNQ